MPNGHLVFGSIASRPKESGPTRRSFDTPSNPAAEKSAGPLGLFNRTEARLTAAMIEDQFIELIDRVLRDHGSVLEEGEEFREPPLDVLGYYRRAVQFGCIPFFGKSQSVVMVVRQPV